MKREIEVSKHALFIGGNKDRMIMGFYSNVFPPEYSFLQGETIERYIFLGVLEDHPTLTSNGQSFEITLSEVGIYIEESFYTEIRGCLKEIEKPTITDLIYCVDEILKNFGGDTNESRKA